MLTALRRKKTGQIAVVLILFVAILLAAFAVTVNIGKVSQSKVSAILAVDGAAVLMASLIASLAESQYQGIIMGGDGDTIRDHGDLTRGESSSSWTMIASLVIAIIGLVIVILGAIFTAGTLSTVGAWIISIAAVVLATASIIIQLAVIAPAMQNMWNRMFAGLPTQEQYREQGIQGLLSFAAQDPVLIDDIGDYDMDGYFKGDGTVEGEADKVGRFSFLYTRRAEYLAKSVIGQSNTVKNFLKALAEFMYDQTLPSSPYWQVFSWDPTWQITPDGFGIRDKDHDAAGCPLTGYFKNECASSWCTEDTYLPNMCPSNGTPWKLIYDFYWERPSNTFSSFREQVGRDDENPRIRFTPVSQNPMAVSASAQTLTTPEWTPEDATGLYRLLWELDQVNLASINSLSASNHAACKWCGAGSGSGQNFSFCPSDMAGFTLPKPQACSTNNPLYQSSPGGLRDCWCLKSNVDPLVVTPTQIAETTCYSPPSSAVSFEWKKGVNKYCSEDVPYAACAGKNCDASCVNLNNISACCVSAQCTNCSPNWTCGLDDQGNPVANKAFWREDLIDTLRYGTEGLDQFITDAEDLMFQNPDSLPNSQKMLSFFSWIKKDITVPLDLTQAGSLQKWIVALEATKQELLDLASTSVPGGGSFVCSGGTPSAINACLNTTLTNIQNCMDTTYCANNISVCDNLATQLGLYFEEPASGAAAPYVGQSTGCTAFTASYVFQDELQNWKKKLEYRRDTLVNLLAKAQIAMSSIDAAKQKIQGFLDDPRVELMRNLIQDSGTALGTDNGIVVYAWRDEAKDGQPATSGRWHAVRAEAFLPTLCGGKCKRRACDGPGNCEEPYMPWIKNWAHDVGTRYWYSLIDYESPSGASKGQCGTGNGNWTNSGYQNKESYKDAGKCFKGGLTRASLIRYDESGGALNWATGIQFWSSRFFNPNVSSTANADDIETACQPIMQANGNLIDAKGCSYGVDGAFVLNCKTTNNQACWDLIHDLLKTGTQTESCAEYFCRRGSYTSSYRNSRFGVKFVPCPHPW